MNSSNKFDLDIDMIVDWVQVTFHDINLMELMRILFNTDDHTITTSGRFGYNCTFTVGNKIHIMRNTKRPEMGVHVLMSGFACRELEQMHITWKSFFQKCVDLKGHFTRLDIAIDTYKKYFTVQQLKRYVKNGQLVSSFRNTTYLTQYKIKDGSSHSATLHFGSMRSDIYIVFYDKLAERKDAGYSVDSRVNHWVRCEIRYKSDYSDKMVDYFLNDNMNFSKIVLESLYSYLDFKDRSLDKNKSRWPTAKFWADFIGSSNKLKLSDHAIQSDIQKKIDYCEAHLYKLLSLCYVSDPDAFSKILFKGIQNIDSTDLMLINHYCINNNMKIITRSQLENMKVRNEQLNLFNSNKF